MNASRGEPSCVGLLCREAKIVLKALTTEAPATACCSSSAPDVPVVTRSVNDAFSGFVESTTTLPDQASPTSATMSATAAYGTARTTTSAPWTATALDDAARQPAALAASSACSVFAAETTTS